MCKIGVVGVIWQEVQGKLCARASHCGQNMMEYKCGIIGLQVSLEPLPLAKGEVDLVLPLY